MLQKGARTSFRYEIARDILDRSTASFTPRRGKGMANIEIMRQEVSALYNGARWRRRVRRMPDDQVMAIFFRERKKAEEEAKDKKKEEKSDDDIPF